MTYETGLAKVDCETSLERGKTCELRLCARILINVVDLRPANVDVKVDEEINMLSKTERVDETCTKTPLIVRILYPEVTCLEVRDKLVETSLFVAPDSVDSIPENVEVYIVLIELGICHLRIPTMTLKIKSVLYAAVTETETNGRSNPLTHASLNTKTTDFEVKTGTVCSVSTCTNGEEPVVPELVRFIRTANNVAVLITISILLCVSIERECQKTCYCKCSKNGFQTFHNKYCNN